MEVYAAINNLQDKRYAETSALNSGEPSYNAGLPRNVTLGLQLRW